MWVKELPLLKVMFANFLLNVTYICTPYIAFQGPEIFLLPISSLHRDFKICNCIVTY
jgi:hypothetical protein